jgi:hypothetical protein
MGHSKQAAGSVGLSAVWQALAQTVRIAGLFPFRKDVPRVANRFSEDSTGPRTPQQSLRLIYNQRLI